MTGKYFEELEVGMKFEHMPHRTITETDNFLFTAMTHNPQPLHLDVEFAKTTQHGQIIVNRRHDSGNNHWQSGHGAN